MSSADISFDGHAEDMPDVNSVISASEDGVENDSTGIPIKKLENAFETMNRNLMPRMVKPAHFVFSCVNHFIQT